LARGARQVFAGTHPFAGIRERVEGADVPVHFRGVAIAMVTAGLMALAFMGFAGLDKYQ
jgi:electron transport complex protein RnfA